MSVEYMTVVQTNHNPKTEYHNTYEDAMVVFNSTTTGGCMVYEIRRIL